MNGVIQRSVKLVLGGLLLYGLSLMALGVLMAGAGHGTYLLLCIASAPLSFLGFFVSLAGSLPLWTGIGGLLPYTWKQPQRRLLVSVILLHYLGVLLIPFFDKCAEWKYLEKAWGENPLIVLTGLTLYFIGQIMIWFYWFKTGKTRFDG